MKKTWTIIKLLNEAQRYFTEKDINSARLDAEILLSFALKKDRINLYIDHDKPVNENELSIFRECVRRRAQREPVAYITGDKEFWSLNLKVDKNVLIPRPETELAVEKTLSLLNNYPLKNQKLIAADIGTGSGAIAIALTKELTDICFFAVDISFPALKVAKKNIRLNETKNHVHPLCADGLSAFKDHDIFDIIVSNPPYISSAVIPDLQPEISGYEPCLALDGGADGLAFYRNNISRFSRLLKSEAFAVVETGADQGAEVSLLFEKNGSFDCIEVTRDYSGRDRIVSARKKFG